MDINTEKNLITCLECNKKIDSDSTEDLREIKISIQQLQKLKLTKNPQDDTFKYPESKGVSFIPEMFPKNGILDNMKDKDTENKSGEVWKINLFVKFFAQWREFYERKKSEKMDDNDGPPPPPLLQKSITSVWKEMGRY